MTEVADVDGYLKAAPQRAQPLLREVRPIISESAPGVVHRSTLRFRLDRPPPAAALADAVRKKVNSLR
jgi:hypothetical protein